MFSNPPTIKARPLPARAEAASRGQARETGEKNIGSRTQTRVSDAALTQIRRVKSVPLPSRHLDDSVTSVCSPQSRCFPPEMPILWREPPSRNRPENLACSPSAHANAGCYFRLALSPEAPTEKCSLHSHFGSIKLK